MSMERSVPTAEASFAAIRARSKFGIAIAAMIRITGIIAIPIYPSTKPAVAIPAPPSRPADLRISERAIWPRITAAIEPKKTNPTIPQTRLAIAFPLVGTSLAATAVGADAIGSPAPGAGDAELPAGRASPQPTQYFV